MNSRGPEDGPELTAHKWGDIGDTIKGKIVVASVVYERDNYSGTGKESVMTLGIELEDGTNVGVWPRFQPYSSLGGAVAQAASDSGNGRIEEGGTIAIKYTADLDVGKGNPARQFIAKYEPPAAGASLDDFAPATEESADDLF